MSVFTNTKFLTVEEMLDAAVEACQPSPQQHERALRSYRHVGNWICDPDGSVGPYSPRYTPQGSFVYGTVVRPLWQHEFDLDALARLMLDPFKVHSEHAYAIVANRIAEHEDLKKRMELHPRCIRLNYKDDFHHDVTPSCDDPRVGRALLVPAKKEERFDDSPWASWKANDPAGYALWFAQKNVSLLESRMLASLDPAPPYVPASGKTPLRKIVQLLKMRRNQFYKPEDVPSSIMLTTMAAECYAGQSFTLEANIDVIRLMLVWADNEGDSLKVPHPTIPEEDLARGLNQDGKARLREFLRTYLAELLNLQSTRGIHRITESLGKMYHPPVADASVRSLASNVQDARSNGTLHVARAGAPLVVVTGGAAASSVMPRPNPIHTFHGGPFGG